MSGEFLLSFVYFYLFLHYKERYVLIWAFSWLSYAFGHVFAFWYAAQMKFPLLILFNQASLILSGLFLLAGTYAFVGKKMPRLWAGAGLVNLFWLIYAVYFSELSIRALTFPTYQLLGFAYIWTGWMNFISHTFAGIGRGITGSAFIIWGAYKLVLPFLEETWLTPWGYLISWVSPWGFLISMMMTLTVAIGILLAFFNRVGMDLQKSEERFRLLAENARDIMYRISLAEKFRIDYISPAASSILGYSPAELYTKGKYILRLVASEDRNRLVGLFANLETRSDTIRWIHRNGNVVWMEHNNVPLYDEAGKIAAMEGIARDITERKKAEAVMVESRERLARAERMASLGLMAAGIAHEINQPLNSIKVNADGLIYLERVNASLEKREMMENIRDISRQAGRIDEIIRHVRSFLQADTQRMKQACNLNAAVESALLLVGIQLSTHNIMLVKDLQEGLPLIEAQVIHLEEVTINLIVNAMQALDKIERANKQITCRTYAMPGVVVFEVADNGPGVEEEIRDKLFEPFLSTNTNGESMGLGLCIVQSIVGSYNGKIRFQLNDAGETVFQVEFPLKDSISII